MVQLSVGYVAGIIAAGIFVARLWSPNAVAFILSGLLRDKSSAASWTVASTTFQHSHWPDILRTDTVQSGGVRKDVLMLTRLLTFMGALIAVAGVVTPLGLYEVLLPADSVYAPFQYLADTSAFGYGTPPRSNFSFSRICGTGTFLAGPLPCPFSDTIAIISYDSNGTVEYNYPHGINMSIPDVISDIYSSGTDDNTTVSNYFDIQWRRYITTSSELLNNGSTYLLGAFKNMQSLILNNATQAVEGLVVDSVRGAVGLRNHTFPPGFQYGVTWKEDLLFIEPETVCVDTNLTLDYTIVAANNSVIQGVVLTDRGGFVNLNHTYPKYDLSNPQKNPDLLGRAYKAAWLNNAYTALFYNVTNPGNTGTGTHAFSYLNSEMNKTFPLAFGNFTTFENFGSLVLTPTFGDYLTQPGSGIANASGPLQNLNPFGIGRNNFSLISLLCAGAGNGDFANITNILVACGGMHGVPQRQGPGSPLVFDAGSSWSQKLYTCASAVKATIKTVSFNYNATDGLLSSLAIVGIQDKSYAEESSMPLWGVENTGNKYRTTDLNLVWGLVSPTHENNVNVSTVRQPSLYLPGWVDPTVNTIGGEALEGFENMPGSDFSVGALETAYCVSPVKSSSCSGIDYSGDSNMAMWARWQNLTQSAKTASLIPNLIFTDTVASAIVGTKGVLGSGNAAKQNLASLQVTPTVLKVQYNYLFAIPILLAALILVLVTLAAFVMICLRGAGISRMRHHLQQVSAGRIYTMFLFPGLGRMDMKGKEWNKNFGSMVIDLSGEYPIGIDTIPPPKKEPRD